LNPNFICCQIGAREHYAIPRSLHQAGHLTSLITDAWVDPHTCQGSWLKKLSAPLSERFHPELAQTKVTAFTASLISFEFRQRSLGQQGWQQIINRNSWFQNKTLAWLKQHVQLFSHRTILFSYSYGAKDLLVFARKQGWYTVLGQIDPGPLEEEIVTAEALRCPNLALSWEPAPSVYWQEWYQECELADRILVNSPWSKQALVKVGVPENKLQIIPLAYKPPQESQQFERTYPKQFSSERPLRILFLGQVILRKGIAHILEAIAKLKNQPIEWWIVGTVGITLPDQNQPQTKWYGSVPRSEVGHFYQNADLFLLPTLSDGFGLTQLEAQAWKLPIIASQFCAPVVQDQVNGIILTEVSAESIIKAVSFCLHYPAQLQQFSQRSLSPEAFSLVHLQSALNKITHAAY
jgi:glycosyltransferase involved in cell wall biosynthesis